MKPAWRPRHPGRDFGRSGSALQLPRHRLRNEYLPKELRQGLNYIDEKEVVKGRTVRNDDHPAPISCGLLRGRAQGLSAYSSRRCCAALERHGPQNVTRTPAFFGLAPRRDARRDILPT